jgi:hypothetical protein
MNRFKFSIIRLIPDPVRAESINVGLVVCNEFGLDIRILQNARKLKAVTSLVKLESLNEFANEIEWIYSLTQDFDSLSKVLCGSLQLSAPGAFALKNPADYDNKIDSLMKLYVNPSFASNRAPQNKRIITELKEIFGNAGILGRDINDINNHRVVSNYPISEDEGIYAELLLKNGAYHLTETLDLRNDSLKQKMGDSALKAITITKAKEALLGKVKSFVVYAAKTARDDKLGVPQLNLVEGYADNIFNIHSADDMAKYFDHMYTAAGKSINYHH